MTIFYTKAPSAQMISQMNELVHLCTEHEPITFSSQTEDCSFVLLYDNQILLSFISLFFPDEDLCECTGFTHPSYRRQGYFSQCLEQVCDILAQREAETGHMAEITFLSDGKSPDAAETLKALDAEFWYAEFMMEISVQNLIEHTKPYSKLAQIEVLSEEQFQVTSSSRPCGTFYLYLTPDYAFLHQLFIEPNQRKKGLALASLYYAGTCLIEKKVPLLRLQVSGLNLPALSLYKKAGFQIVETLSYYLY